MFFDTCHCKEFYWNYDWTTPGYKQIQWRSTFDHLKLTWYPNGWHISIKSGPVDNHRLMHCSMTKVNGRWLEPSACWFSSIWWKWDEEGGEEVGGYNKKWRCNLLRLSRLTWNTPSHWLPALTFYIQMGFLWSRAPKCQVRSTFPFTRKTFIL